MSLDWDRLVLEPLFVIHSIAVQYRPRGSAPYDIEGIFDNAYRKKEAFPDGSVGTTTVTPILGVRTAQFLNPPVQYDQLYIYSVNTTYAVKEVRPDSKGWALLELNKVSSP